MLEQKLLPNLARPSTLRPFDGLRVQKQAQGSETGSGLSSEAVVIKREAHLRDESGKMGAFTEV